MTERRYLCEACDGGGIARIVTDRDIGKACQVCDGRGWLDEAEMERIMTGTARPNVFDWRLFAREKR